VADFSSPYTWVTPEVVRTMGDSGGDPIFQNDKGVVVHVTRRIKMVYGVCVSLLDDSFKIILRGV